MKFDWRLLIPFKRDVNVMSIMRGNEGHAYLYITGMEEPRSHPIGFNHRQAQGESEGDVAMGRHIRGSTNTEHEML